MRIAPAHVRTARRGFRRIAGEPQTMTDIPTVLPASEAAITKHAGEAYVEGKRPELLQTFAI